MNEENEAPEKDESKAADTSDTFSELTKVLDDEFAEKILRGNFTAEELVAIELTLRDAAKAALEMFIRFETMCRGIAQIAHGMAERLVNDPQELVEIEAEIEANSVEDEETKPDEADVAVDGEEAIDG